MATANTIEVLRQPDLVDCVHATTLGFGERAGNAALEQVIVVATLKLGLMSGVRAHDLVPLASHVQRAFLTPIPAHAPIFGEKVFQHESGLHQRGLMADPSSYQWLTPETVGRAVEFVLGKHSGQALRHLIAQEFHLPEERIAALQNRSISVDKEPLIREFLDLLDRTRRLGFLGVRHGDLAERLLHSSPDS
jgi:isopropylmalate/homocitrate/citramalate synthase